MIKLKTSVLLGGAVKMGALRVTAVDIDEDGLITVEQNNKIGYVKIEDVEKIEL